VRFDAEFTVWWPIGEVGPYRTATTQDKLTLWAADVSSRRSVLDAATLQAELNRSLRQGMPLVDIDPTITCAIVRISVDKSVLAAAQERDALRRQSALTKLRQEADTNRLRYLHDTILADPALLMAWLLESNPSAPGEVLKHEEHLKQLAQQVNSNTVNQIGVEFAKIATRFVERLEAPALNELVRNFKKLVASFERDDLAKEISDISCVGLDTRQPPEHS
jgi:hypothetical protein